MTTPTAEIVDLEAHRRRRERSAEPVPAPPFAFPNPVSGFAMVMMPVTFVMLWSPMPFMQGMMATGSDGSSSVA